MYFLVLVEFFYINVFLCIVFKSLNIHWVSKQTYHFFRATLIKIQSIKINHNWAHINQKKEKSFEYKKKEKE